MTSFAPEALVQEWLGPDRVAIDAAIFSDPFYVPFDQLVNVDGWAVWLGHPPVPDGLPILPIPERFLWGDPITTVATSLMVAADYAVRRGAIDAKSGTIILERECPLALIVPGDLHRSVEPALFAAARAGLPIVRQAFSSPEALRESVSAFGMRSTVHRIDVGRRHDPALSFQQRTYQVAIGGNSLSTFIVHNRGERDQVSITGDVSDVVGIEIGLTGDFAPVEMTSSLEVEVARVASFLDGVSSWLESDSLAIGWDLGAAPSAEAIGEAFRVYLRELFGAPLVDVRIVFAPKHGGSLLLSEMRARATTFRHLRSSILLGLSNDLASDSYPSFVKADKE